MKKNESPDEEYLVVLLVDGIVTFTKRYGSYENAWKAFSRLSMPAGYDDELREAVFRIRRSGCEWKDAARCTVGPRPDDPPMPKIVVTSRWGFETAEDVAYVDETWIASEIFDALVKRYSDPSDNNVKSVRWEAVGGKVIMEWKRKK